MTARIIHIVTDMGNGGAHCGACWYTLSSDPLEKLPSVCPKCGATFTGEDLPSGYAFGGSDF
jgi:predicted amidophosphoribosyltransferase